MIAQLRQEGDRCLVFTQFVRMGRLLQEVLLKSWENRPIICLAAPPGRNGTKWWPVFRGQPQKEGTITIFLSFPESQRPGIKSDRRQPRLSF